MERKMRRALREASLDHSSAPPALRGIGATALRPGTNPASRAGHGGDSQELPKL